ncbi:MAG: non-canonical purine NTP pyrophosphatase [Candidatus Micrarchaeota archaeon]|nr:non-canonical purine NTP pyrophosphatase [Candidatus Micrarchaeota archaeon]MDE1847362.1 non-canonical purine NTP pyrophosphatase [Candidatus Micrarchaeota archaeon]MDE1863977.1 non-canonical purine NTP pyrophosphatase [Candidatus Micrarchaeota archaeon]
MEFIFVTSNPNKLKEAQRILKRKLRHSDLDLQEVQSMSCKEVALDKAKAAYSRLHQPVLIEDTGLYINCLNGFPGALVKWAEIYLGYHEICRLVGRKNRGAHAETVLCLYDGKKARLFSGRADGCIANKPVGKFGFGFDVIFLPSGSNLTLAQMSPAQKDRLSHRTKAFQALAKRLKKS